LHSYRKHLRDGDARGETNEHEHEHELKYTKTELEIRSTLTR